MSAPHLQATGNYAIKRLADSPGHEFNRVPGCPPQWPVLVDYIGEAQVSPWVGRTVIAATDLRASYESLLSSFQSWFSNTWQPFMNSEAANERAQKGILEEELQNVLSNLRNAYTNWATLSAGQKDTAQRQSIRAIGLLFQLGKLS